MSSEVRVRFAPSPTGPLHLGGVRTALFNYLFARHNGGTFILRIEDTDRKRYVPGAEEYILESMEWCGMEVDEGVREGGPYGPYRQSERKEIYKKYIGELFDKGKVYYAFDTPEELEKKREEFSAGGKVFMYNHEVRETMKNSLVMSDEEVQSRIENGEPYVVRFRIDPGPPVQISDIIRGELSFDPATLDDKVLFKSDGLPTYHLANIVDDRLMEITHVIRGEEWLPSLPLHVLLYRAFGWEPPGFAHLPLILKHQGKGKLSKRDGDKGGFPVFPLDWKTPEGEVYPGYREQGYFPEAFVNMLALLGWNPGTEQEIFSMDELIEHFSLERINKAGARFDPQKARWFNHQYLQMKSDREVAELFLPLMREKGVTAEFPFVEKVVGMVKERVDFVKELWEEASFFFQAPESYDDKVVRKRWKGDVPELMRELKEVLAETDPFDSRTLEETVKQWIEEREAGMGKVLNALRLLLVGASKGPHLCDIMALLGKKETLRRMEKGMEVLMK